MFVNNVHNVHKQQQCSIVRIFIIPMLLPPGAGRRGDRSYSGSFKLGIHNLDTDAAISTQYKNPLWIFSKWMFKQLVQIVCSTMKRPWWKHLITVLMSIYWRTVTAAHRRREEVIDLYLLSCDRQTNICRCQVVQKNFTLLLSMITSHLTLNYWYEWPGGQPKVEQSQKFDNKVMYYLCINSVLGPRPP